MVKFKDYCDNTTLMVNAKDIIKLYYKIYSKVKKRKIKQVTTNKE